MKFLIAQHPNSQNDESSYNAIFCILSLQPPIRLEGLYPQDGDTSLL